VAHPEPPEPTIAPRRRSTATSNFGAGRRESHDATAFYERFEAPTVSGDDAVVAPYDLPEPFQHADARHMDAIVDGSVALVVTSPPYFAGKQYEEELERDGVPSSYVEYLQLLTDVFAECARKLEPGGRIAVNVATSAASRIEPRATSSESSRTARPARAASLWAGRGRPATAWGSFGAMNPVLPRPTDHVVIASKGRFDRAEPHRQSRACLRKRIAPNFPAPPRRVDIERACVAPAPFPVGLPGRLIGSTPTRTISWSIRSWGRAHVGRNGSPLRGYDLDRPRRHRATSG
jgi:site-specific DNA-methyltransferase (adenine-specific)